MNSSIKEIGLLIENLPKKKTLGRDNFTGESTTKDNPEQTIWECRVGVMFKCQSMYFTLTEDIQKTYVISVDAGKA